MKAGVIQGKINTRKQVIIDDQIFRTSLPPPPTIVEEYIVAGDMNG